MISDACLSYLHLQLRMLHRDIKSHNIMVSRDGRLDKKGKGGTTRGTRPLLILTPLVLHSKGGDEKGGICLEM